MSPSAAPGMRRTGWRSDRHPRFLIDINGDGRPDIVGFADAGVKVSLNRGDGTFGAPTLVVPDFGYKAGGWRVFEVGGPDTMDLILEQAFFVPGPGIDTIGHPRTLADLTGDGRPDIVGFADWGVKVSYNDGKGAFSSPKPILPNFGQDAGWRVHGHIRELVDLTGDGRADIIGFGDGGVWVALNTGAGLFQPPKLVLEEFGYEAGGWRLDEHPRSLADLTGDRRPDIVGFANAGVFVALNNGNGTFGKPRQVLGKRPRERLPRR
ncbi:MAG: VCBS repeat-containing protein [Nannocystis sp.]|nr:VCBS repeat-containing protein [Nannocystis sp.]